MSVGYAKILLSNNERQQMKLIKHSLQFVTELDETNLTAQRLLALPETMQIAMLESMLKELLAPALKPAIDELNAGNSFATLKVIL
jgi:cytochrome c-type biogenesis protein CcmH/NrfG